MDFYGRVKQLVKKKTTFSLQEFIISTGLSIDTYYSLKKAGNLPRADEALKIAQALGTTVECLITGLEADLAAAVILEDMQAVIDRHRNPPAAPQKGKKA